MKKYHFLTLLYFFICTISSCQTEPPLNNLNSPPSIDTTKLKGLLYDEATLIQLQQIVARENLKFKTCEKDKIFYSIPQTVGSYIRLKKNKDLAKKLMTENISFEDFKATFPEAEISENNIILANEERDRDNQLYYTYSCIGGSSSYYTPQIKKALRKDGNYKTEGWVFEESSDYLKIFYLATPVKSMPLTPLYSNMIQYADCLIDSNHTIFLEDATSQSWDEKDMPAIQKLLSYLKEKADSLGKTSPTITKDKTYQKLYAAALLEIKAGKYNPKMEHHIEQFSNAEDQLLVKRSHVVIGFCSHDDSPRLQAQEIAILSAQTQKWEIFLRAHLNIMNDYFARRSDNSMQMARRKTYIRELEVLDINIIDLIFGITLRTNNSSPNHYYGSVNRLGKAISEAVQKDDFEKAMLNAIENEKLDLFNRYLFKNLWYSFAYYLTDPKEAQETLDRYNEIAPKLPEILHFEKKELARLVEK